MTTETPTETPTETQNQDAPSGGIDLSKYDIVLAIDKSGSMRSTDMPGGKSRWDFSKEYAQGLAHAAQKFDDDGISVVVFNDSVKVYDNVTPDVVDQVYSEQEPMGGTNTSGALKTVLDSYFERKSSGSAKPMIIQVITDGAPNDQKAVAKVIVEASKKLDNEHEVGIQFLQFGKDEGATKFLEMLDDDLEGQGAKYDIVDAKPSEYVSSTPVVELLKQALTD